MSATSPKITCLFFTDASLPAFLNTATGRTLAGDLLVECAPHPALTFALNLETPANYPGAAGLLGGVDVGLLAHASEHLPAPILLAPGASVSTIAMRSALALLRRPDERLQSITLLVPVDEARNLGAALGVAQRYAVAWDVNAFPHEELASFASWLTAEKLLTADNFAGLFPYSTRHLEPAHAERLASLFEPFAHRLPKRIHEQITLAV
jgi:hypothetical protein